jgi:hypothetical protein
VEEEAEPVAPVEGGQAITVDLLLPYLTERGRVEVELAVSRLQAAFQTQRANALEAEVVELRGKPRHNGRVTTKAKA